MISGSWRSAAGKVPTAECGDTGPRNSEAIISCTSCNDSHDRQHPGSGVIIGGDIAPTGGLAAAGVRFAAGCLAPPQTSPIHILPSTGSPLWGIAAWSLIHAAPARSSGALGRMPAGSTPGSCPVR